jgi:hypothetical protein
MDESVGSSEKQETKGKKQDKLLVLILASRMKIGGR